MMKYYGEQVKELPAKRNNFRNFEIFRKIFGFFSMNLTYLHRWNNLNTSDFDRLIYEKCSGKKFTVS